MAYFIPISLGLFGVAFLYKGAELFLNHSSALARFWRVPLIIIGLTIVALGTSLPELVVGIIATTTQQNDIILGNVVGSNIANIGIVLGISALICPIKMRAVKKSRLELFTLFFSIAILYLMALDLTLSRVDGTILLGCGISFAIVAVRYHRHEPIERDELFSTLTITRKKDVLVSAFAIAAGLALLFVGATMVVTNAVAIARLFHLSELFIGMTVVAVGTSLPEIVTAIVGSLRKSNDLVVGNVVGSNIFNILIVLGVSICITPVSVATTFWRFDLPVVLLATIGVAWLLYSGRRLGTGTGIALVGLYVVYLVLAFLLERSTV